jgi:hypothetical protein
MWQQRAGLGNSPRTILEELARIAAQPLPMLKQVQVRCKDDFLREIDDWRSRQRPIPTRSEAIRQLAMIGLKESR